MSDDFLMAAGNDSYWMTACEGDFTHDPFNACQVPRSLSAPVVSQPCRLLHAGLCCRWADRQLGAARRPVLSKGVRFRRTLACARGDRPACWPTTSNTPAGAARLLLKALPAVSPAALFGLLSHLLLSFPPPCLLAHTGGADDLQGPAEAQLCRGPERYGGAGSHGSTGPSARRQPHGICHHLEADTAARCGAVSQHGKCAQHSSYASCFCSRLIRILGLQPFFCSPFGVLM